MPWRSTFILTGDIDNDGRVDIVSGGSWYENPGELSDRWVKKRLGKNVNNVAVVFDLDADGDLDVFASTWNNPRQWTLIESLMRKFSLRSWCREGELVWAENDGNGHFTAYNNIPSGSGDFLQGSVVIPGVGNSAILVSWHNEVSGLQLLTIPSEPSSEKWEIENISAISQDEEVSVADIDLDGDIDILQGTLWLRNDGYNNWTQFRIHETDEKPDRHRYADINGDGRNDIIIGYEAVSRSGLLAWYDQVSDAQDSWLQHRIATVIGPMSLDVADMDDDGDNDVIIGEHNLESPKSSRLMWFENILGNASEWNSHLIYRGDEHHDGALVIDIDNDGDKDVLSIGWGHDLLLLYENLANK